MHIDFLEAADGAPLCKTHEADANGNITTTPYPLTKNFNSFRESITTIDELFAQLQHHSSLGRCALKGKLTVPALNNESRKNTTSGTEATEWICLDLDFDGGYSDIESFILSLGPEFHDVSYIFQHSNSAGIKGSAGPTSLRGHLYFLLGAPLSPPLLKEWLKEKNLTEPTLRGKITLAKNGHSLIWPLDITTCQNDKLIFISPPKLVNCSAGITKYFTLVKKSHSTLKLTPTPNPSKNKTDSQTVIKNLRTTAGLPVHSAKYKTYGSETVLINPDPMVISDTQDRGDHVRVNLVGDNPSWGYYYYKDSPEILHNFKGAPLVQLRDVDPTYYQGLKQANRANRPSIIPVVFRDFTSDAYFNGVFDPKTNTLELAQASNLAKLSHFLGNHGIDMPDVVPDFDYEFNPTTTDVIDFNKKWANRFSPTEYIRDTTVNNNATIPPVIDKVLTSICVDTPTKEHFLNWLSYIYQTRNKAATSWLFSGVEGTGKGLLASEILQPLFGEKYVTRITSENLEDLFNANFEEAIFVFVDEFNISDTNKSDKVFNKIKNLITENRISIRRMRTNAYEVNSYLNIIMATNAHAALPLSPNDRRFNIAPAQDQRLPITTAEVRQIPRELADFGTFLRSLAYDEDLAKDVIINQARLDLIDRSQTSIDLFWRAVRESDIHYFLDFLPGSDNLAFDPQAAGFEAIIRSWVEDNIKFIPADELRQCYNFIQNTRSSAAKFGRAASHHQCHTTRKTIGNRTTRGYEVDFPAVIMGNYFTDKSTGNVVHMQK